MSGLPIQLPAVGAGATELAGIDLTKHLKSGETVTVVVAVDEVTTSDLTLDQKGTNGSAIEIRGRIVAAGKALLFRLAGPKHGVDYVVKATVQTSRGRILPYELRIPCQ